MSGGAPSWTNRPQFSTADRVRHLQRLGLVVRHIDGRDAELLLQAFQLHPHFLAQHRVEVAERSSSMSSRGRRTIGPRHAPRVAAGRRTTGRRPVRPDSQPNGVEASPPWF